jgi:hypothetical protein
VRALGTLALLVWMTSAAPAQAQGPCAPQPSSNALPPLTRTQCVEASGIVARDTTLHKLLARRKYSVGRPDPWGSGDGTHNIGAVVHVRLAAPLTVARVVLPVADFAPGGRTYTPGRLAASLHGTRSLDVFVGFRQRRVVWIIPFPGESEGPPPTSIPPYTAPPGFAMGTGGASPSDAASGLVVHSVTFDSTGRLEEEGWFDPLTAKAVTTLYDAERKVRVRFVSLLTGKTLTVTTIAYSAHTWTSGKGTIDPNATGVLLLDSRTLPARIKTGGFTPDGEETVGGVDALRLHGKTGIVYFGISFEAADGTLWLDPATYLPLQQTLENHSTAAAETKTLYSWQPRTGATAGATTATIPKGYKHTASTGLPHIFGD